MLDASSIIELFLRYYEDRWKIDDPMFVEAWLLDVARRELLLLENYIPLYVIEKLYHLAFPITQAPHLSFGLLLTSLSP